MLRLLPAVVAFLSFTQGAVSLRPQHHTRAAYDRDLAIRADALASAKVDLESFLGSGKGDMIRSAMFSSIRTRYAILSKISPSTSAKR